MHQKVGLGLHAADRDADTDAADRDADTDAADRDSCRRWRGLESCSTSSLELMPRGPVVHRLILQMHQS